MTGPALIGGRFPPQEKASGGGDSDPPLTLPSLSLSLPLHTVGSKVGSQAPPPASAFLNSACAHSLKCQALPDGNAPEKTPMPQAPDPSRDTATAEMLTPTQPHPDAPRSADT